MAMVWEGGSRETGDGIAILQLLMKNEDDEVVIRIFLLCTQGCRYLHTVSTSTSREHDLSHHGIFV